MLGGCPLLKAPSSRSSSLENEKICLGVLSRSIASLLREANFGTFWSATTGLIGRNKERRERRGVVMFVVGPARKQGQSDLQQSHVQR